MITIDNISKSFKKLNVLRNMDLKVNAGDLVLIQGSNGSGKSTLLKIMCGLMAVDSGVVTVDEDVSFGVLIENPSFIENENLMFNLKFLFNLKNTYNQETVIKLCSRFDLALDNPSRMKDYSVGMRQKAGIIQAMMEDQDILLFDEPTRGLDAEAADIFVDVIHELHALGKTIIICAHEGVDSIAFNQNYRIKEGKFL